MYLYQLFNMHTMKDKKLQYLSQALKIILKIFNNFHVKDLFILTSLNMYTIKKKKLYHICHKLWKIIWKYYFQYYFHIKYIQNLYLDALNIQWKKYNHKL